MRKEPTLFSTMGDLKRVKETDPSKMTRGKPRSLRRLCVVDNKHHPDFYIAGLVIGFLGIQVICRWYPVLSCQDGAKSFFQGVKEGGEFRFEFSDLIGDLWRVRKSDPVAFDAAITLRYGSVEAGKMIAAIESRGETEFVKLEKERESEMEAYGNIDAEWLGKWRFIGDRRMTDAQL